MPDEPVLTWGILPDGCLDCVMVCSPHFDDAALGAAYLLLAHPGSTVVTVYGGRPAAYPEPPSEWDALGGFRSGDDVVALRREEDRAAMRVLGAVPRWFDFVDHQYLAPDERRVRERRRGCARGRRSTMCDRPRCSCRWGSRTPITS